MDRDLRRASWNLIAKQAGILTDLVGKALNQQIPDSAPIFKPLGSVGPGTSVLIPSNPVKSDGSVDIVFNFRGLTGDIKSAASLGINAVIVTAEATGPKEKNMGSALLQEQFGNAGFINSAVAKIINNLKSKYPNAHLGKLAISGFSGGGSVVASLLAQKSQLPPISAAIISDGLHADKGTAAMEAVVNYGKEAQKDPSKRLVIINTPINPMKYRSTRSTANEVKERLGLETQKIDNWNGKGVPPISMANQGGVRVIDLFDKELPWLAKDDKGVLRPHVDGKTDSWQHREALNHMKQNFADYLAGVF